MAKSPKEAQLSLDAAWQAVGMLNETIAHDAVGGVTGAEVVAIALDLAADRLAILHNLDQGESLDAILAQLDQDDTLVGMTARLMELTKRADYAGGLSREEVVEAEELREHVHDALNGLLDEFEMSNDRD